MCGVLAPVCSVGVCGVLISILCVLCSVLVCVV